MNASSQPATNGYGSRRMLYMILMIVFWALTLYFFFQGLGSRWYAIIVLIFAILFTIDFLIASFRRKGANLTNGTKSKGSNAEKTSPYSRNVRNQTNQVVKSAVTSAPAYGSNNPTGSSNVSQTKTSVTQTVKPANKSNASPFKTLKSQAFQTLQGSVSNALSKSGEGSLKNRAKKVAGNTTKQLVSNTMQRFLKK